MLKFLGHPVYRLRAVLCLAILVVAIPKAGTLITDVKMIYVREIRDPQTIREYLDSNPVTKLQLGAGGNNPRGWLNSDIEPEANAIYLDAAGHYPFPDNTFKYIFAEHLIEHLSWEEGLLMLKECHRVLAPGGKIRVITPDLARLFYALNNQSDPEVKEFVQTTIRLFSWPETPIGAAYVLNKTVHEWGHKFIYDGPTLKKTFESAGFVAIRQLRVDEPTDPVFRKAELRTNAQEKDVWMSNRFGALAMEASK